MLFKAGHILKEHGVEMDEKPLNSFSKGFRDGFPIAMGYISVAFTFGMMAVNMGLPVWSTVLISITNLTSAGQFAGIGLMVAHAPMIEMALTQLVINLRYALMSLSLSQKVDKNMTTPQRAIVSIFITDEIFAVASGQPGAIGSRYMYGLASAPCFGWVLGTLIGAVASTILPASLRSALGIAIYGMFLAIIIPPAKKYTSVFRVLLLSVILSCLFRWVPVLNNVSSGFVIIICTIIASVFGAKFFPVKEGE